RCPVCTKVYLPPRGPCPTCAVLLAEPVELGNGGTVTTFCVVNVPFLGQSIEIPYVAASVLVDGADIAFSHLIQGCDASEVRMGMRVEAVWRSRADGGWCGWRPGGGPGTTRGGARRSRTSTTSGRRASPTRRSRPTGATCEPAD